MWTSSWRFELWFCGTLHNSNVITYLWWSICALRTLNFLLHKNFQKSCQIAFSIYRIKTMSSWLLRTKIVASIWRKIHSYTSLVFRTNWNHYFDLKFKLSDISDASQSVFPFQNCLKIDNRYTLKEKHKNSKKTNCKYGIKRKCQKFSFDIEQWTFW